MPDGQYLPMEDSHLKTLIKICGIPEPEVWDRIPTNDSPLFWLIAYTGCVITDLNSSVGMKKTPQQENTYRALVSKGTIVDKYYDISAERERASSKTS